MQNDIKPFHTPAPWGIHPFSENATPFVVNSGQGFKPWVAMGISISSGKRIIGELKMTTVDTGTAHENVDNEQELRANVERICALINICEGLTIDEVKLAIGAYYELSMREDLL